MTNYEKFKETIVEFLSTTGGGLAVVNGEPRTCVTTSCKNCDFYDPRGHQCKSGRIGWLDVEYVGKPKLTKAERAFCESLSSDRFYFARDKSGDLYVYNSEPQKGGFCWDNRSKYVSIDANFFKGPFDFIKWEDSEPWSVEELLKLEVIDDE